jgi:putative PIN family toxin of toxin-antitoxin system
VSDKPRVVIDTQIFLRATINRRSLIHKIVFEMQDHFQLIFSDEIKAEVNGVLHRPKLRNKFPDLTDELAAKTLAIFNGAERVTLPDPVPQISRDPKDDMFLACATTGNADYLLSEDKDLLVLEAHHDTKIVDVPTFFRVIQPTQD